MACSAAAASVHFYIRWYQIISKGNCSLIDVSFYHYKHPLLYPLSAGSILGLYTHISISQVERLRREKTKSYNAEVPSVDRQYIYIQCYGKKRLCPHPTPTYMLLLTIYFLLNQIIKYIFLSDTNNQTKNRKLLSNFDFTNKGKKAIPNNPVLWDKLISTNKVDPKPNSVVTLVRKSCQQHCVKTINESFMLLWRNYGHHFFSELFLFIHNGRIFFRL